MTSLSHLAAYIGIETSLIRQILHNRKYHYRHFELQKKDGSTRVICAPRTYLKVIQWWMLDNVFQRVPLSGSLHGFIRGRSYITNAETHKDANHLLCIDLDAYFPSISVDRVANVFQRMGYKVEISTALAQLITYNGSLPQGSPCSPYIANIVFSDADRELEELCLGRGYRYTRYADDITISAEDFIPEEFLATVRKIVAANGFRLNPRKTRFAGRGDRMEVTGLVVNSTPSLPREWRYRAKAVFHQAIKNPENYRWRLAELQGLFGALRATDPQEEKTITRKGRAAILAIRELMAVGKQSGSS